MFSKSKNVLNIAHGQNGLSQPYAGPATTGQSYGEAVLARATSTHTGKNGGTATDLDIVYGTVGY
jgi:hypothetical protein